MEFWDTLPSGGLWIHEIKHDGFRIVARKNGAQVRLYNRPGNDLTGRIPCLSRRWQGLPSRSLLLAGLRAGLALVARNPAADA
jgi:bifunctional non-homologous end joining protein LigD